MKKVLCLLFLSSILFQSSSAQISGIINIYTKVTTIDPSCNKIIVSSTAGFAVGDTVLLIQMQGATIDETNNAANFGNINPAANINYAGNYEFANITAIQGNDIYLKHTLLKSYDPSGSVQLVSVPQYTDITVSGILTAKAWDGNTGGVLVFEASGTITLEANIDVSGLGFRGGNPNVGSGSTCGTSNVFATAASNVSAFKGEGIAKFITGKENGRGKQANGGGGGNSNNTGGGGGSNFGTGGNGGSQAYLLTGGSFSGCNFTSPGFPGIGGLALPYSNAQNKIFMGGGGGGGHQNNWTAPGPPTYTGGTPGGNGGGIVIIKGNTIDGKLNSIHAQGALSALSRAWGDGGGGGGGGGTVLLSVNSFISNLSINVKGGQGDNVYDETSRDLGPGGGGGGGMLWVSNPSIDPAISLVTTGGISGVMQGATTSQNNHGATAGSIGGSLTNLVLQKGSVIHNQTCIALPVELLKFSGKLLQQKVKLEWITSSEKNNDFFTIERTTDFNSFKPIGTVDGRLNSNSQVSYFIYDHEPEEGISYYRLSQTDVDGSIKVLGIISITTQLSEKLIYRIYPVPFQDKLTIELGSKTLSSQKIIVTLYNSLGEMVFQSEFPGTDPIDLSLQSLPSGLYTISVQSEEEMEITKIVK